MATKIESLRIATRNTAKQRRIDIRFVEALRRWTRNGQLGQTGLEMRRYTGAR